MKNYQSPRFLFTVLGVEVFLGLFFLIFSGGLSTIFTVLFLGIFIGGGIFILNRNGMLNSDWLGSSNQFNNTWNPKQGVYMSNDTFPPAQPFNPSPSGNTGGFNLNVGLGINPGLERSEIFNQDFSLPAGTDTLQVDVNNGDLKVVGEPGLTEVRLSAVKRVWEKDEASARRELDRLQVRSRQEGHQLIIEAGQFDGATHNVHIGVSLGKPPRIDLVLAVPPELAFNLATNTGTLELRELKGEIAARTIAGTMNLQNINGGRNLTIGTNSGRITMQQITAGILRARATTGSLDLMALGAEVVELDTMAGLMRVRGVNCDRFAATASTGQIELSDINSDGLLQLKATAGRIQTDNIRAAALNIETTTGAIRYRGTAPTASSQVQTGVGSTELIFAPGANFNLEARSNVGSVQVMLPVSNPVSANRNWFHGQIGTGGPDLNVVSQVGSVRIWQG